MKKLSNISRKLVWVYFSRVVTVLVGVLVSSFVARSLGVGAFGEYAYVITIGGAGLFLANFSIETLGVKEYAKSDDFKRTLGNHLSLKVIAGGGAWFVAALFFTAFINDVHVLALALCVALYFCMSPAVVFETYLYSSHQADLIAKAKLMSVSVYVSITGVIFLYGGEIWEFLLAFVIEGILYASIMGYMIKPIAVPLNSRFIYSSYVKGYLIEVWPLIISSGLILIYNRTDIVMLDILLGKSSVGLYSAGIKISEASAFMSMVLISFFMPYVSKLGKKEGEAQKLMEIIIGLVFIVGLALVVFFVFCADFLVLILYGESFSESSDVLVLSSIATLFSNIAVASSYWLVIKGLQFYRVVRAFQSLILNVVLNMVWIPKYGIIGAAAATIVSQVVAAYFGYAISKRTRSVFLLISRALLLKSLVAEIVHVIKFKRVSIKVEKE